MKGLEIGLVILVFAAGIVSAASNDVHYTCSFAHHSAETQLESKTTQFKVGVPQCVSSDTLTLAGDMHAIATVIRGEADGSDSSMVIQILKGSSILSGGSYTGVPERVEVMTDEQPPSTVPDGYYEFACEKS